MPEGHGSTINPFCMYPRMEPLHVGEALIITSKGGSSETSLMEHTAIILRVTEGEEEIFVMG